MDIKPEKLDLFAIARENGSAIQKAFESIIDSTSSDRSATVHEFADWIEAEAVISINVRLFIIVDFLNGGGYQNIYERTRELARLIGRNSEDLLREQLRGYYGKRKVFDGSFHNGERFRYGALNAGGAGLSEYGPYAVIMTRDFQSSLIDIAILPGDSLKICLSVDEALDIVAVRSRTAPFSHRHQLATIENASAVHSTDKSNWAKLVVSPTRFFEVIFLGDVYLRDVQCVRVMKSEYDRMWDMAFASFGRKLGEAERALVNDFIQLRRGEMDGKIHLEVVQ